MQTFLFSLQIFIAIAIIIIVLVQRSEGGALGIGGGSNSFMTGRGAANLLTRITAILGVCFFLTSIGLALLAQSGRRAVLFDSQPVPEESAPRIPLLPLPPESN